MPVEDTKEVGDLEVGDLVLWDEDGYGWRVISERTDMGDFLAFEFKDGGVSWTAKERDTEVGTCEEFNADGTCIHSSHMAGAGFQ